LGGKGVGCLAAAIALAIVPAASASRLVSVGYTSPASLHGLRVVDRIAAIRVAEVRVPNGRAVASLRSRSGIRFVQRAHGRVEMSAPSIPAWQWSATRANLVPSWVNAAASSVKIAVIDTGADLSTPTLAAKNPITWNVVTGSPSVSDVIGHGTFVASLAAGADTDGVSGFGGDAQLMVVQANRGGTGFSDIDEASAITWAVDNGARIINLSLGGAQTSAIERNAIAYATSHGVLIVAAAGNSAEQGNPLVYPAALLGESGLVVGAATTTGTRALFSSTGSYVDVLAPGVDVLGALAKGAPAGFFSRVLMPSALGSYAIGSGTSYAAPEVAGAAALVWAANPSLSAEGVAATIEATSSNGGSWTTDLAFGNVDVAAAVARATSGPAPVVTKPVVVKPVVVKKAKARAITKKTKKR
jgi:subtilisin family serine protease